MISRNLRSYFLFSISTTLSFVIVLSYLFINDSILFNKNKTTYMNYPNLYQISYVDSDMTKLNYFMNSLKVDNIAVYDWKSNSISLKSFSNDDVMVTATLLFMNHNQTEVPYFNGANFESIDIIQGEYFNASYVSNNERVVIVGESFANNYDGNIINKTIKLEEMVGGDYRLADYRVIGVFDDTSASSVNYDQDNDLNILFTNFILPYGLSTSFDPFYQQNFKVIVSDNNDSIQTRAWDFGINLVSSHSQILSANVEQYNNALSKGIILLIVFIVLGSNAYSSSAFSIQKRKKEIGIKLALGITKTDIFIEFFIESIIVMIVNLMISVIVVTNIGILIGLYYRLFIDSSVIMYISLSSFKQFLVFSIFLISINCIILANQAMNISPLDQIRDS